jgi:glutaconate CoA-transferase subunit A
VFSWAGNPGVGSLHRIRDAVERDWPAPLEIEEHTHAGMAAAWAAGASNLPFGVLRGYTGTDLVGRTTARAVVCPFSGETLTAVPAQRPDVGIVHAQQADRSGNVQLWGIVGVQKEVILAARHSIVTVEEVVDEFERQPESVFLPHWTIDAIVEAPGGARPSYAHGYYDRDNDFYAAWEGISRDRVAFQAWVADHVTDASD